MASRRTESRSGVDAAELRRLESQISHSDNISATRDGACVIGDSSASRDGSCVPGISFVSVDIKPDTFDGTVPLREFLIQFNLIARINAWSDAGGRISFEFEREGACNSQWNE